jgi:hypothetical protein
LNSIYICKLTDFRLSQWLIIDVNSVVGLLHFVVAGNIADILKMHAAPIFMLDPEAGGSV